MISTRFKFSKLQLGAELRARRIFWPKLAFFDGVGCALHAGTVFALYLTQITPVSHNFVRNIFPLKACIEWYQNLWTKTGRYCANLRSMGPEQWILSQLNSLSHTTPMPRKKPEVPLRRHYSTDLKQRVIYQAFTLGKKSTEIAIDLDMPVRVVQRVKQTWMQIGRVRRSREFIGRHPLLSPEQTKVYFLQIHSKFMSVTIFAFHRSCWP